MRKWLVHTYCIKILIITCWNYRPNYRYRDRSFLSNGPTSLTFFQLFIVQKNIHVFKDDEIEELANDILENKTEGVYRFIAEEAQRHPGKRGL